MNNTRGKKKILYITTKSNWNGRQKYILDLATNMPSNKYEVAVAFGGSGTLQGKLKEVDIPTHPLPSLGQNKSLFSYIRSLFALLILFRREKPDIIHLNSEEVGIIGSIAGHIYGKSAIIFTAHGWVFRENSSWASRRISIFFLRIIVSLSNITIAVSNHTKEEISKPATQKKIVVIHNGVAPFEVLSEKEARRKLLDHTPVSGAIDLWNNVTLWVGTIAELHKNNALDVAIDAIDSLLPIFHTNKASLIYFIIGGGELKEELEKRIHQKKLSSSVFLVGEISEARKYLNAFDIFLLPSRKQGLPHTILEAGMAKRPVIGTSVGGIPEIIKNGETGILTKPDRVDILSDTIKNLARHPDKRKEFGENIYKTVMKNFTKDAMLDKTENIYKPFL